MATANAHSRNPEQRSHQGLEQHAQHVHNTEPHEDLGGDKERQQRGKHDFHHTSPSLDALKSRLERHDRNSDDNGECCIEVNRHLAALSSRSHLHLLKTEDGRPRIWHQALRLGDSTSLRLSILGQAGGYDPIPERTAMC